MVRLPTLALIGVLLVGCVTGDRGVGATPGTPSPSPLVLPTYSPPPEYQPPPLEDPTDPVLIAYCSAQDRVVTLEGPVLAGTSSGDVAVRKMREAKRVAALPVAIFERAGEPVLARLAQRWSDSFDVVVRRLQRGDQPIDALRPALAALGAIERRYSCELDG